MACGIPIITWNNSAAIHVVEDAGIVVSENNIDLYKALKYFCDNSLERWKFGNRGIKLIKTKYSLDKFVKSYCKLYKEIYNENFVI